MSALLSVSNLTVTTGGQALVSDVSFDIAAGARFGLIGESGSGKSMTAMAAVGLLPAGVSAVGSVTLDGREVIGASERRMVGLRGSAVAVVFQEPMTALDPLMRIGRQVAEPLRRKAERQGVRLGRDELRKDILRLLNEVLLPDPERILGAYPHQISGGQRQRVAIAMALACDPKLLVADEPTTALDVTTQAEILKLLDKLVSDRNMALLFISHDLPIVAEVTERVMVLRRGEAVEEGGIRTILKAPQHDYTRALVDAARAFDRALEGTP